MRPRLWMPLVIIGIALAGWWLWQWFSPLAPAYEPGDVREVGQSRLSTEATVPADGQAALRQPAVRVETVAGGLDTPWSLAFTSSDRILVTERPGRLRVIEGGLLRPEPLHIFDEVSETGEEGLMSLALHPQYAENRWLYVALAYPAAGNLWVKVVRFTDAGSRLSDPTVILDRIPAAKYHAGCAIAFGPDGKLYVTTGDATDRALAQDLRSLAGKILRLNDDGSIPSDNPFGTAVWSYGHRNGQGIAWHPVTGALYASEHGPSVFDGPAGGDEVNLIERGKNYGWPLVSHEKRREGTEAPLLTFTPAEAPASLMAYSGRAYPAWQGNLFFGALRGEGLMRLELDLVDPGQLVRAEKLDLVRYGRIRFVGESPDGSIYFTTSNRDGRGTPAAEDDRVMRIRWGE